MELPKMTSEDLEIFNAICRECLSTGDEYRYISSHQKIFANKFDEHMNLYDFMTSLCILEFHKIIEIENKIGPNNCRITTLGFNKYVKDNDIDLSKTKKDVMLNIYQGGGTFIECDVKIWAHSYDEYCGFILRELQENGIPGFK
ncbi:MAG: hypothetical protein QTN59_06535 [Candidatus Electrothrix communis]|nr:MAG: hypothetical protein QTN59_06535 [Candidatus Electrothrix communis]